MKSFHTIDTVQHSAIKCATAVDLLQEKVTPAVANAQQGQAFINHDTQGIMFATVPGYYDKTCHAHL